MADVDLLTAGLYTVPEVARLVGAPINRVRGWVTGYPRTKAEPIIRNDVGWMNGTLTMSFANLMEVRFIQFFAGFGVRVASLRMMAAEAQRLLKHPHPFATSTVFTTDGRKIFAIVEEMAGDKHLYDLRAKNWAFFEVIEQSLKDGVLYDPAGDAIGWRPRPTLAPNVIIFPGRSFGQPILRKSEIPTKALFNSFTAEGETYSSVAAWYDVPVDHVEEAVRFEMRVKGEPLAA